MTKAEQMLNMSNVQTKKMVQQVIDLKNKNPVFEQIHEMDEADEQESRAFGDASVLQINENVLSVKNLDIKDEMDVADLKMKKVDKNLSRTEVPKKNQRDKSFSKKLDMPQNMTNS